MRRNFNRDILEDSYTPEGPPASLVSEVSKSRDSLLRDIQALEDDRPRNSKKSTPTGNVERFFDYRRLSKRITEADFKHIRSNIVPQSVKSKQGVFLNLLAQTQQFEVLTLDLSIKNLTSTLQPFQSQVKFISFNLALIVLALFAVIASVLSFTRLKQTRAFVVSKGIFIFLFKALGTILIFNLASDFTTYIFMTQLDLLNQNACKVLCGFLALYAKSWFDWSFNMGQKLFRKMRKHYGKKLMGNENREDGTTPDQQQLFESEMTQSEYQKNLDILMATERFDMKRVEQNFELLQRLLDPSRVPKEDQAEYQIKLFQVSQAFDFVKKYRKIKASLAKSFNAIAQEYQNEVGQNSDLLEN